MWDIFLLLKHFSIIFSAFLCVYICMNLITSQWNFVQICVCFTRHVQHTTLVRNLAVTWICICGRILFVSPRNMNWRILKSIPGLPVINIQVKYNLSFLITFYSLRLLNGRSGSIVEIMVQTGFEKKKKHLHWQGIKRQTISYLTIKTS